MNNDVTDMGVVRRTLNPMSSTCQGKAKSAIWILGGSAIYGVKVPDSDTLPSYLSRDLNAEGECVEVTNLGVEGYVSSQELIVLLEELKAGRHPDIVIFYDGFNDSFVTMIESQEAGNHMGLAFLRPRVEGSIKGRIDFLYSSKAVELAIKIARRIQGGRQPKRPRDDPGSNARATVDNFQRNLQLAKVLGASYNFKVYGVWQPIVVFGNKPLTPFEKYLADTSSNWETPNQAVIPVYQEAQRRAATTGEFLFLGNVFDSVENPVYLDCAHLSPRGNEIAAQAVAQYIRMANPATLSKDR